MESDINGIMQCAENETGILKPVFVALVNSQLLCYTINNQGHCNAEPFLSIILSDTFSISLVQESKIIIVSKFTFLFTFSVYLLYSPFFSVFRFSFCYIITI